MIEINNTYLEKTPNFNKGNKKTNCLIVNHVTAGDKFSSCANWFLNKQSQVSSNFVIDKDGAIYQFVKPENIAWANGTSNNSVKNSTNKIVLDKLGNANNYSISIEVVDKDGKTVTDKQVQALYNLNKYLYDFFISDDVKKKYKIDDIITGHFAIDPVNKPICGKYLPLQKVREYVMNTNMWEYDKIECKVGDIKGVMLKCDKVDLCVLGDISIKKMIYPYTSRKGDKGIYIEFMPYNKGNHKMIDKLTNKDIDIIVN